VWLSRTGLESFAVPSPLSALSRFTFFSSPFDSLPHHDLVSCLAPWAALGDWRLAARTAIRGPRHQTPALRRPWAQPRADTLSTDSSAIIAVERRTQQHSAIVTLYYFHCFLFDQESPHSSATGTRDSLHLEAQTMLQPVPYAAQG